MSRSKPSIYAWNQLLDINLYAFVLYADKTIIYIGYTIQSTNMRSAQHQLENKKNKERMEWVNWSEKIALRINGKVSPNHPAFGPWKLALYEAAVIVSHEIEKEAGIIGNTQYPISEKRITQHQSDFDPMRIYKI